MRQLQKARFLFTQLQAIPLLVNCFNSLPKCFVKRYGINLPCIHRRNHCLQLALLVVHFHGHKIEKDTQNLAHLTTGHFKREDGVIEIRRLGVIGNRRDLFAQFKDCAFKCGHEM